MRVRENYFLEFLILKSIFHEKQKRKKECHILSWKTFEKIVKEKNEKEFFFAKIMNDLILNVNLSLTYYLNGNKCLKLMNGGSTL